MRSRSAATPAGAICCARSSIASTIQPSTSRSVICTPVRARPWRFATIASRSGPKRSRSFAAMPRRMAGTGPAPAMALSASPNQWASYAQVERKAVIRASLCVAVTSTCDSQEPVPCARRCT